MEELRSAFKGKITVNQPETKKKRLFERDV